MITNSYSSPLICIHLFLRGEFTLSLGVPQNHRILALFASGREVPSENHHFCGS
ncbi:unnamed protein product [Paramecium pentaurelia]|uniref:Uncharacterized protein n=1 Tax=Paramecium pentaurelia TaxID=43138 RepID=A0A8S1V237_9CILI|nr:unnamed protein product [Paramecium pentaurelia]